MKFRYYSYTLFFVILLSGLGFAQKDGPLYDQAKEITFNANTANLDSSVRAEVYYEPNKKIKLDLNTTYYWFYINKISSTQGGFEGRLLHGTYTCFYPNNALKEKGKFKDGQKTGQWIGWYTSGKIKEVSNWSKSHKNGVNEFYDNSGHVTLKLTYKHGKLNGSCIEYKDGKESIVKKYKNGKEIAFKPKTDTVSFSEKVKNIFKLKKKKEEKTQSTVKPVNNVSADKKNNSAPEKKEKKKKVKKEKEAKVNSQEPSKEKKKTKKEKKTDTKDTKKNTDSGPVVPDTQK